MQLVITRTSASSWSWRGPGGATGVVVRRRGGNLEWAPDSSGWAVTAVMVLDLYPNPPRWIVYDVDEFGSHLEPPPPQRLL